jgi:hypothetical protein
MGEKGSLDELNPAEGWPHHWRAIDRDIPSQVARSALLGSVFPGSGNEIANHQQPQNHWTQEPMPGKIHHSGLMRFDAGKVADESDELVEND